MSMTDARTLKEKEDVSILDESLLTGEQTPVKILCTAGPQLISIAAYHSARNKFSGLECFHFNRPLTDSQLAVSISELAHKSTLLRKVDFRNVSVQFASKRFTLMPAAIFKEEDAGNYFYFNHCKQDDEEIYSEVIRSYDAVNIFGVPGSLISAFKKLFDKFSVHHHLTGLIAASKFDGQQQPGKNVFINVRAENLDVIVVEDRKLLLANSYPFKTPDEGLYFIVMVFEQLSLNAEKAPLILTGEIDKNSPLIRQMNKYIRNISFGERIRGTEFTYGFNELSPHYYHSVFSHILCES